MLGEDGATWTGRDGYHGPPALSVAAASAAAEPPRGIRRTGLSGLLPACPAVSGPNYSVNSFRIPEFQPQFGHLQTLGSGTIRFDAEMLDDSSPMPKAAGHINFQRVGRNR